MQRLGHKIKSNYVPPKIFTQNYSWNRNRTKFRNLFSCIQEWRHGVLFLSYFWSLFLRIPYLWRFSNFPIISPCWIFSAFWKLATNGWSCGMENCGQVIIDLSNWLHWLAFTVMSSRFSYFLQTNGRHILIFIIKCRFSKCRRDWPVAHIETQNRYCNRTEVVNIIICSDSQDVRLKLLQLFLFVCFFLLNIKASKILFLFYPC